MCEVGDWVRKIHDALKDLDAQKSPRYEAKLKKLSLHMIRCTEFIKSKRPSFEDSAIVNTILSFGGELLFHEVNHAKVEDLLRKLRDAQYDVHREVTLISLKLNCTRTKESDIKSLLPDLFDSFMSDINQHLGEFKAGSRGWIFEVTCLILINICVTINFTTYY